MSDLTPMVKQYLKIKEQHKDAIVFYRLGDFYEMFNSDAEVASKELDLVLTGRGVDQNRMSMCGVPYHAADNYIAKLIDKGFKVAICEQVEDPKDAKGVVKREVIRIVTPGTVIESNLLPEKESNYLLAITKEGSKYGLAFCDASTGEFKISQVNTKEQLLDEINRIAPREIIVSDMLSDELKIGCAYKDIYDQDGAQERLKEFFKVNSLDAFGIADVAAGLGAAAAVLDYLKTAHKTSLMQIKSLGVYNPGDYMLIDSSTRRNLELVQTIREKGTKGSLLWVLDQTLTAMGSRMLKNWVLHPQLKIKLINLRLDAVEELFKDAGLRARAFEVLNQLSDVERLIGRIAGSNCTARDLVSLKQSLGLIPKLQSIFNHAKSALLCNLKAAKDFSALIDLLSRSIVDEPPFGLKEGGLIKPGFDAEIDEVNNASKLGKDWISHLENEERKRTGIKSLKVGFTRVFGYYIEVTNSNLSQVPDNYIRKQTLVNCERFITPELKEKEAMVLSADERMKEIEYKVFCRVREQVAEETLNLQQLAAVLAQVDCLLSLAQVALDNHYCRPEISNDLMVNIKESRHPVIEKTFGAFQFVPNLVELDKENNRFLLITGPNMAGKSTYMRQIALTCIMAQMGSFVPAKSAKIGLVDRIFTRIGAMDDIFSGQSTFMMEMTETANIINNATEKSLIILDEIGRGTATFDGMSIAAAVAEYIHTRICAKTLFATHYHEITQLADKHPGMKNMNVLVKEEGDHIMFLHKIVPGTADKSYGIQVAKLAGLPQAVISRAKEIYGTLESFECGKI